jgi:hypothetical protein
MTLFCNLVKALDDFVPETPLVKESILEDMLEKFLKKKGFLITRQVTKKNDRYDLICKSQNETVCIELKKKTDISDIKQYDTYLPKFKDGLIIVCWQSSFSVRDICLKVKEQSPIPVTLIILSERYGLA